MILLDSNVLVAFFNKRDSQHDKSVKLMAEIENEAAAAIPSPVIFETSAVLRRLGASQRDVAGFLARLNTDFRIIETNQQAYPGLFETFRVKTSLSLVDCLLLELAQPPNVTVATFDDGLAKAIRAKKQ